MTNRTRLTLLLTLLGVHLAYAQSTGWISIGPDTSEGRTIKQITIASGTLLAVSDRGVVRYSHDTSWSLILRNYFPPSPSLQDPSRNAECVHALSIDEMLVGWNGMLVNVNEPTAGLGLTLIDTARWGIDVWSGGGFPTSFNVIADLPPGVRLYADLYGLVVSNDSGRTWSQYPNRPNLWNSKFLKLDGTSRYIYGTNTAGLISFDLASHRTDTLLSVNVYLATADLAVAGDTLLFGLGDASSTTQGIYRSSNRGGTWIHVLDSTNVFTFAKPRANHIVYAGGIGVVHRSTDAGLTWAIYNNTLPQFRVSQILQDPNSDTLFVATLGGGVVKLFAPFTVDVPEDEKDIPSTFSLSQNYPNPFNPTTTIRYSLPSQSINSAQGRVGVGSHVTLKVYDVLGREVAMLVNEEKPPVRYEVTWNAQNVASGVYFYRLTAGGNIQTKKMILMR